MKILLIRFSALGDVAMLAAVVREIAQERKDDDFTVLSMPHCSPLFDEIGPNVHFLGRNVKRDYKGVWGLRRLFHELDRMHFDYVCDMHDVLRTKILRKFFMVHGYKYSKIDKHRELRKKITAQGDKKQLIQVPTSFENYKASLPPYGHPLPLRGKGLNGNGSLNSNASQADNSIKNSPFGGWGAIKNSPFGGWGAIKNSPFGGWGAIENSPLGGWGAIGIAPFAAHEGKIYPLDKMERVIELLGTSVGHTDRNMADGISVYLFGGGGKELEIMQQWADKYPWVHLASDVVCQPPYCDKDGKGGLRAELKLMRDLDVMVSMDSANMHLASLVGTRVVSVWGATHPFAGFLGYGQSMDDCVQLDMPCRPCSIYGNKPCIYGDHRCMTGITPEMVVKRILLFCD